MKISLSENEVSLLSDVLAFRFAELCDELSKCDSDDFDTISEEFNEVSDLYSKILSYL